MGRGYTGRLLVFGSIRLEATIHLYLRLMSATGKLQCLKVSRCLLVARRAGLSCRGARGTEVANWIALEHPPASPFPSPPNPCLPPSRCFLPLLFPPTWFTYALLQQASKQALRNQTDFESESESQIGLSQRHQRLSPTKRQSYRKSHPACWNETALFTAVPVQTAVRSTDTIHYPPSTVHHHSIDTIQVQFAYR